jgi:hypothetical protein
LDSPETVRRLLGFYVNAHYTELPYATFCGQTADEMYFSTGNHIPDKLDSAKKGARTARIVANQAISCEK